MSAPTLGTNWQEQLGELRRGWDSDRGSPITVNAIATVQSFATVPCSSGGIQLEVHRNGFDVEIDIEPDGRISSVFVGRAR